VTFSLWSDATGSSATKFAADISMAAERQVNLRVVFIFVVIGAKKFGRNFSKKQP